MTIKEKEKILLVSEENIPEELKNLPQWVLWDAEWNEERQQFEKIPYQINGKKASSTDFATWNTFDKVFEIYEESNNFEGIGFVLSPLDQYCVVDIDDISDVYNLDELASEITDMSYAEVSPSGTGTHIWFRYKHNKERHKNKNADTGYEIYDNKRFITVTGQSLNDLPINDGGAILDAFLDKVLKRETIVTQQITAASFGRASLSEDEIIRRALNGKNGDRFYSFLFGGWEPLFKGDYSSADMSFLNDLSFWCNKDPVIMDSIYRKSKLFRDKWDRPEDDHSTTYGQKHILKAISECKETYNPQESNKGLNWWRTNGNGTLSFIHRILAREVLKEYSIVRYPNPHSDLYYYNPKKGIYEQDKSGRQISGIIRSFDDDLKNSQIREVYHYIQEMSPVINSLNENYIAVENGLLNLKTFQLEPFDSKKFVLQKISVNYKSDAYDEFIASTLRKVTKGHSPSEENIKEIFACVLYPGVLVPKIHYLLGRSAHNGKSSILNMIHQTFNKDGGNISAVTPQKLASSPFAGASIYGKLANIVDDNPESLIEDSGLLKTVVTGGFAEIERKGRDSETVRLSTTMIIASNHFPNLNESGNAINRRLNIIPFEHNFSLDNECLPDEESMRLIASDSAREYVLKLAVDALKRMINNPSSDKLTPNEKAMEAASAFAEHNDPWGDYFHEFDEQYFNDVPGFRAISDYEEWCKANRIQPLETKKFKEVVNSKYDMEWKTKKIKYHGDWKSYKGFKSKTSQ